MTLKKPKIMGILNVTPNSYFETGKYFNPIDAIEHGMKLEQEGAHIIDIGGCSTKPFSSPPSIEEEIRRTEPVVKALAKKLSVPISIDTYNPEVAQRALDAGATFLNDITGFTNPKMRALAKAFNTPICIMHMQNKPLNMQENPSYPKGVVEEVCSWLKGQVELCIKDGINPNNIYLDPGIGFGKSLDDNFEILHNLKQFVELKFPLLIGLSRKTFLYKTLNTTPQDSLAATIAMNSYIYPYVDIFRVHDVSAHKQMSIILNKVMNIKEHVCN